MISVELAVSKNKKNLKCFVYINFHKHLNFNRTNLNEAKDQPTSCRPLYCLHFSPIIIFKNN